MLPEKPEPLANPTVISLNPKTIYSYYECSTFFLVESHEWNWTVNGVAENTGSGSAGPCGACIPACTVSGSGAVPINANGITATVKAQVESGKVCTVSTSQSFSNKGTVSIKNLSVTCQGVEEGKSSFIEATFNLKS